MNALIALLFPTVLLFQSGTGGPPEPPKMSATLYAARDGVMPGEKLELAVEIKLEKGWHIYHPVHLDAGGPTTLTFSFPQVKEGKPPATFGAVRFPTPDFGEQNGFEYLAYEGGMTVLTDVTVDSATAATLGGTLKLAVQVDGITCHLQKGCTPVKLQATLDVPIASAPGKPVNEKQFAKTHGALPKALADAAFISGSSLAVEKPKIGLNEPNEVIATIKVKPQHHIQAPNPGIDGLIGTRVMIEPISGIKFDDAVWPEAAKEVSPGVGTASIYRGEFKVHIPFKVIDGKFSRGPVTLRALVYYQCCMDRGSCFPPEMVETSISFEVDSPNAPSDPNWMGYGTVAPAVVTGSPAPAAANQAPKSEIEASTSPPGAADAAATPPIAAAADAAILAVNAADYLKGIPWQPYKPGLAEELSRRGRIVYVDYTADWCLTCKTNLKTSLEVESTRTKMRDLKVIPLVADYTKPNPDIAADLRRFEYPNVPMNIIYRPKRSDDVIKLPTLLTPGTVAEALDAAASGKEFGERSSKKSLAGMLLLGFLGGVILNIMPCVLPVISIKILSFVQQAHEDRGRIFRMGLAFSGGIMVWFWLFAWLSSLGRVPLQSPIVVISIGTVLFVMALNLFGVFEITLPGSAAGTLDNIANREGYLGSFFKGFLATLLGTACSAPFLVSAVAWATTQPAIVCYLVFSAAGVGMATPYLLLSTNPGWLRFVPRPGAWMVVFKQSMGFVLVATVLWLLWILKSQRDGGALVGTLCFWTFLAMAVWLLGKITPSWSTGSRLTGWVAATVIGLVGWWFSFQYIYHWSDESVGTTAAEVASNAPASVARASSGP